MPAHLKWVRWFIRLQTTHIMPTVNKKQKRYPWQSAPKPFEQMKDRAWSQALYNSWRWRKMAKAEIVQEPYCAMCYEHGIVTTENLQRDHVDGFTNEDEFWNGRRQTLCKWHNMNKAQRKGAEATNKKNHGNKANDRKC